MESQKAAFNGAFFLRDLQRLADANTDGDLARALGMYFKDPEFVPLSKEEQGTAALHTALPRNMVTATANLFRALEVQPDQAAAMNVFTDYMGFCPEQPSNMWAMSWLVEKEMQWPVGTLYPDSKYLYQAAVDIYLTNFALGYGPVDHQEYVVRFIEVEAPELASMVPRGEATRLLVTCLEGVPTPSTASAASQ